MNGLKLLLTLATLGLLTTGCGSLKVAPAETRNQFRSLPTDATTPPAIRQFLPLYQDIETTFEQRMKEAETRLQQSLSKPNSK